MPDLSKPVPDQDPAVELADRSALGLRLFHSAVSWRNAIRLSAAVLITWLVFAIMLTAFQRQLVFLGHRGGVKTAMPLPVQAAASGRLYAVEVPNLGANDAGFIRGWLSFPARVDSVSDGITAGRPLVVYFGGNASNRSRRLRTIDLFNLLGCDVLIVDYRGYADNEGSPSERAFVQDAQAVWKFATADLGVPPDRIVLCGESLGGAVATRLAADVCSDGQEPAGLILRATFATLVDTAAYHYPFVPVRALLVDRFRTIDVIENVTCPILQFHGIKDKVVPYRHGRELFKAAPEMSSDGVAKRWVRLQNAGHNDILWSDREAFVTQTQAFLETLKGVDATPVNSRSEAE